MSRQYFLQLNIICAIVKGDHLLIYLQTCPTSSGCQGEVRQWRQWVPIPGTCR